MGNQRIYAILRLSSLERLYTASAQSGSQLHVTGMNIFSRDYVIRKGDTPPMPPNQTSRRTVPLRFETLRRLLVVLVVFSTNIRAQSAQGIARLKPDDVPQELHDVLREYFQKLVGCDTNCRCGGSQVVYYGTAPEYEQFRDTRGEYHSDPISQADRYNGVQLSGYYRMTWAALRTWRRGEW